MKSARAFLVGIYLHLLWCISIILVPIILKDSDLTGILMKYILYGIIVECLVVLIIGGVSVVCAKIAGKQGEHENVKKGWKLLKLATIPFYILNFAYSVFAWGILVGASRGFAIFLVPIPIVFTCTMIVMSGLIGHTYIKYLKREKDIDISGIHNLLQLIPVLDIISTIIILRKEKMF